MLWHLTNQPGGTGTVPADFSYGDPLGGSPQLVGSLDVDSELPVLTEGELSPIVANALRAVYGLGLSQGQLDVLSSARIVIANLRMAKSASPTAMTARSTSMRLPLATAGMSIPLRSGRRVPGRQAVPGSDASGKVDLLTVVLHEFGHELGLVDLDPSVYGDDLMSAVLNPGERRVDVLDALYAQGYL